MPVVSAVASGVYPLRCRFISSNTGVTRSVAPLESRTSNDPSRAGGAAVVGSAGSWNASPLADASHTP